MSARSASRSARRGVSTVTIVLTPFSVSSCTSQARDASPPSAGPCARCVDSAAASRSAHGRPSARSASATAVPIVRLPAPRRPVSHRHAAGATSPVIAWIVRRIPALRWRGRSHRDGILVGVDPLSSPGLAHACGVFGVYAPGQPVAHLAYLGLYALQHRGQESAGIAVSDGQTITVVKDMGLVTQVFDERRLAPLEGHLAIGHNRYSTTGSSTWRNAQPVYRSVGEARFALGHNGNLTNTADLAVRLGTLPGLLDDTHDGLDSTTDSALVAELIAAEFGAAPRSDGRDLEMALDRVLPHLAGGFSFVLMDDAHLIGVRDPHGFWPLVLGRVEGGWVLASETAALDIVGAHYTRDIAPGEMVVIDANGVHSKQFAEPEPKLCLFEFVYFARPDTYLYGQSVHAARQRMGE